MASYSAARRLVESARKAAFSRHWAMSTMAQSRAGNVQTRYFHGPAESMSVSIGSLRQLYESRTPIAAVTVYDYPSALAADKNGVDLVFVDDSLAVYSMGYESPTRLKLEEMVHHAKAVANGLSRAFSVADLPLGCYGAGKTDAVHNATRLMKEGLVKGVKVRGGAHTYDVVRALVEARTPVVGHVQPLNEMQFGDRIPPAMVDDVVRDAVELQRAGAFAVVLECLPDDVAATITQTLYIPTIGYKSGKSTSGQLGVLPEMLGLVSSDLPNSVGRYGQVKPLVNKAFKDYCESVQRVEFPDPVKHCYSMEAEQLDAFYNVMKEASQNDQKGSKV